MRVEALAKALGVTKGGFYGYFADRGALLEAMLDAWERESVDDVLDRVEQETGDPLERARLAGQLTFSGDRLLPMTVCRCISSPPRSTSARVNDVDGERSQVKRTMAAQAGRGAGAAREGRSVPALAEGSDASRPTARSL